MSGLNNVMNNLPDSAKIIVALIVATFLAAVVVSILIRIKYKKVLRDLNNYQQRKNDEYDSSILNKIIEDYKSASLGNYNEVNTQAIIENSFNQQFGVIGFFERFANSANSILIILGLFGTFLGLTLSIDELVALFNSLKNVVIDNQVIAQLTDVASTMAIAFVTSLFGVGCSVVITVLNIIFNVSGTKEMCMVQIEEYLDNTVALIVSKDKETEYSMMNKILKNTFEEFGQRIEDSLKDTVKTYVNSLSKVVMEVDLSSKTIDETIEKFDNALANFAYNIKDLTGFNERLKDNIKLMDVSFNKVTQTLKDTTTAISDNYGLLNSFSEGLKEGVDEMAKSQKDAVVEISQLIGSVKTAVDSVGNLSQELKADIMERMEQLTKYQDSFSSLVESVENSINAIGIDTAKSFETSLSETSYRISSTLSNEVTSSLKGILEIMEIYKENEKDFARTLKMLPDQIIAYNEATTENLGKTLDEINKNLK